jgi:hypothetical protein
MGPQLTAGGPGQARAALLGPSRGGLPVREGEWARFGDLSCRLYFGLEDRWSVAW